MQKLPRRAVATAAHKRKAGPHKDKRRKRQKQRQARDLERTLFER